MRPAFRGYLFVELWPDQQWRWIMDSRLCRGVADLIRHDAGERPYLLAPEFIAGLREAENEGLFDLPRGLRWRGRSKRRADLHPGQQVLIQEGPFAGVIATLTALDDQGRSRALATLFCRSTPIALGEAETATLETVA